MGNIVPVTVFSGLWPKPEREKLLHPFLPTFSRRRQRADPWPFPALSLLGHTPEYRRRARSDPAKQPQARVSKGQFGIRCCIATEGYRTFDSGFDTSAPSLPVVATVGRSHKSPRILLRIALPIGRHLVDPRLGESAPGSPAGFLCDPHAPISRRYSEIP